MTSTSIRVKLYVKSSKVGENPRQTFWDSIKYMRPDNNLQNKSIEELEATIVKGLGQELKTKLHDTFNEEFRSFEDAIFGKNNSDFIRMMDHYFMEWRHREKYPFEPFFGDYLSRIVDSRSSAANSNPEFKELLHKKYLLTQVSFATTIVSYSSLELAIFIGGLPKLIEFYDGHFEYFQTFLSSYLPFVFSETIGSNDEIASRIEANITIPEDIRKAFSTTHPSPDRSIPSNIPSELPITIPTTSQNQKAKFFWQVANYSLLIPVLLALLILYVAFVEISDHRKSQMSSQELLFKQQQELIDYQMKMLKDFKQTSEPNKK